MANDESYTSELKKYDIVLARYWAAAPGVSSAAQASSEQMLAPDLGDPSKISNVAVGLGFVADEELLLAGNLLAKGSVPAAWAWFDRTQAHAHLRYQLLDNIVWRPSLYTGRIFDFEYFCSYFALALARGAEASIRWYAQQVYNLIQGGLADECCWATEYVDLYFDIAITVLHNEWRPADRLDERVGIYRDLFLSVGEVHSVRDALFACAQNHLEITSRPPINEKESTHPFRVRAIGHIAYELMAWIALYKRFHGPLNILDLHPMLLPEFCEPLQQKPFTDSIIDQLRASANVALGDKWDSTVPPDFESPPVL